MRSILLGTLALTLPASADVLVVDAASGPGFDFTDVQVAIDASSDGDTILIRSGAYVGFTVDGKSLAILEDSSSVVTAGYAIVTNLGPEQSMVLRGLDFDDANADKAWLRVESCAGPVWVEDCAFNSNPLSHATSGNAGAIVEDSGDVTFVRVSAHGSTDIFLEGGAGAVVRHADLNAFESEFRGANPNSISSLVGDVDGGPGLDILDSQVWLSQCIAIGGNGTDGDSFNYGNPGCGLDDAPGGAGVLISGLPAVIREAQTLLQGGVGGSGCTSFGAPNGSPIEGTPGFYLDLFTPSPTLSANSPVREGESIDFQIRKALPGDSVFLSLSLFHDPQWLASLGGHTLSPLTSLSTLHAGTVLGVELDFSVTAPILPAQLESLGFYAQAISLGSFWPLAYLGGATHVTLLDAAF